MMLKPTVFIVFVATGVAFYSDNGRSGMVRDLFDEERLPFQAFPNFGAAGQLEIRHRLSPVLSRTKAAAELPLLLNYDSQRRAALPWLGTHWSFPLFESRIIQVDSDLYQLVDVLGNVIDLQKKGENLTGRGVEGRILKEAITINDVRGLRLRYRDGWLSAIESGETPLQIQRSQAGARIIKGSEIVCELSSAGKNEWWLRQGTEKIVIRTERFLKLGPGDWENTVAAINFDEKKIEYHWEDNGEHMEISQHLDDAEPIHFVVETASGRLIEDDEFEYQFEKGSNRQETFTRVSKSGAGVQRYFRNPFVGTVCITDANGITTQNKRFVYGPLSGLIQFVEKTSRDGVKCLQKNIYDQNGKILRLTSENLQIEYDVNGKIKRFDVDGTPLISEMKGGAH